MSGISDLLDLVDLPRGGGFINQRFALPILATLLDFRGPNGGRC